MTHAEALAWARHLWGAKAFVIVGNSGLIEVGEGLEVGAKRISYGVSHHSYEEAFRNSRYKMPDMNHPAILKASIREAIEREQSKKSDCEQVEIDLSA